MVRKNRDQIFSLLHSFSTMSPVDLVDPALDTLRLVLSNPRKFGSRQKHPHLLRARKLRTFNLSKMLESGTISPPSFHRIPGFEAFSPAKDAGVSDCSQTYASLKVLVVRYPSPGQPHPQDSWLKTSGGAKKMIAFFSDHGLQF